MILPANPFDKTYHWDENQHFRVWVMYQARRKRGYDEWWSLVGDLTDLADTDARRLWAYELGMHPGETDLRLYNACGQTIHIELKVLPHGKLSKVQKQRHKFLRRGKHLVYTVWAETPADCWREVERIIDRHARLPWRAWLW